jgi:serine/threonine protein kinase
VASLNHPYIPKVNDWFVDGDRAYLVMEYIQGVTLEDVFSKVCDEGTSLLDERQVGGWAVQLCEVLDYLHTSLPEPIVFGVLQPSNVMLTFQNQIRLIDFGITKSLYYYPQGGRPVVEGGGYWPPERYTYPDLVNPGSDLYALGASLHQLLTGTDPRLKTPFTFHERMLTQLNPNVSSEMEAIIMKCLEYEAEKRYQSASELEDALKHALKA